MDFSAQIIIDPETGCELWQGATNAHGYGIVYCHGRSYYAHRKRWVDERGAVPPKHSLDHLCKVRHCVNLDHLEVVTWAENGARIVPWNRTKTHCPAGHAYAAHGRAYLCKDGYTRRFCRLCNNAAARRRRQRAKLAPAPVVAELPF